MSCVEHACGRRLAAAAAALLGVAATPAIAQSDADAQDDAKPPVALEADTADADTATGVSVYQGNAVMTRGEMRITGERIEVYTHDEGELDHVLVEGAPATFRDHPQRQERPVHAEAQRMRYYAQGPERARFEGDARLWQGEDETTAEVIKVDLETRTMQARGSEEERAQTVIHPGRREAD
ncbi:MAG: lipopolysaccharide transport periplasmic protein LptA [Halorhodospira sp.]